MYLVNPSLFDVLPTVVNEIKILFHDFINHSRNAKRSSILSKNSARNGRCVGLSACCRLTGDNLSVLWQFCFGDESRSEIVFRKCSFVGVD